MALDIKKIGHPGILLRYNGTKEIFYIPITDLLQFKLPDSLQMGGKSDTGAFDQAGQPTGDELQAILDSENFVSKTNLLNALQCPDGMLLLNDEGAIRIEPSKGNKPVIRFPRP